MNAISKGHVVNFAWLWTKARKLQTEIYPTVEIKHHVREKCIRTGANEPSYDDKCGRYKPTERLNVNQSALPFVVHGKKAYEYVPPGQGSTHNKWISQPGAGLEKRQCSLQVMFRPEENQSRLAIIFRGQGK